MTDSNKVLVQRALAGLIQTGDVGALATFLTGDFRHHRPGGLTLSRTEWLAAVEAALAPLAGMRVEIEQLLAEGDHVVVFSRRWLPDGGPEITVVDRWRIQDGLIAEGWELIEPTAEVTMHLAWWTVAPVR
ncbi:nuclear transport factor 2 family protein [Actinoplanes oblitus]|uniref:Nuclear transport factor 2 family protein n=1 Tax=Actinoplanes oblitus TaxID=3040509 RepID=A0ABY8W620_9ACTN|nr:nuclear transport factor 2 family protein [Actinoplanes oblitus]WIM92792.1 nuclear transport factor 2 family protein [Actinoplanes oblitus]